MRSTTVRHLDPHATTVVDVCEFLQFKFEQGLQHQTIKGYVAAIQASHKHFQENSLGKMSHIRAFLRGVFRLRPPVKAIVPTWDLSLVLQVLANEPFEPPSRASLKHWTQKTVFLVAVTSAARVSELQALDSHEDISRIRANSATLRINPSFLPKHVSVPYINREIELESFHPNAQARAKGASHKMCPVRALRIYLQKVKSHRQDGNMFVSYKSDKLGHKVSKTTVARWIRETILFSYSHLGRDPPVPTVRAHSTRAVASSFADLSGVSPADLCKAATWSSTCVFSKHYRLDLSAGRSIATQVLSAAMAARRN